MRNILVHCYFDLDTNLVWKAVMRDLPDLKEQHAT
ncbi:MAG: HepT-like ribonuclease domain-containing protein [Methanothrix sp.]